MTKLHNNQESVGSMAGNSADIQTLNPVEFSEKQYRTYEDTRKYNTYGTNNRGDWFELVVPDKSLEEIDALDARFMQLRDSYSIRRPKEVDADRVGILRMYDDGSTWDSMQQCFEPDQYGESHFITRLVFGAIDPQEDMFGIQQLVRETFTFTDGTQETFDMWVNVNRFSVEEVEIPELTEEDNFFSGKWEDDF